MGKNYYDSPFGIAVHPWINKPDTKFNEDGVYKAGLRLGGPEAIALKEKVDAQAEAYFNETTAEMTAGERKKWSLYVPYEVEEDDEGNPTGFIVFDFKQNAKIRQKDGSTKDVVIGIKDARNNDMHKPVFGGSELRIRYSFRGIKMASTKQAGIRLDFAMVQVRKLAQGSGGGGFGVVDGYTEDQSDGFGSVSEGNTSGGGDGDY